jgi:hypothetical protein
VTHDRYFPTNANNESTGLGIPQGTKKSRLAEGEGSLGQK